jgi:hypothetical protein
VAEIAMAAAAPARDESVERTARAWMDDTFGAFGHSNTAIHSVGREEAEAVQLAAFNMRLEERRAQIPVLDKLASEQGLSRAGALDDAAPLFFRHDIYKSYPASLLAKARFDQLTRWLDRLTAYDLSEIDVGGCASIDGWLDALRAQTPLDVATSSGTSGTLSFFPKAKSDFRNSVTGLRIQLTQRFGEPAAPGALAEPIHVLTPFYRDGYSTVTRLPAYFLELFCGGDPALLHTALPFTASADLLWLAARLRAAEAKGDAGRIDVPESLLARRGEWERVQAETPVLQAEFISRMIPELAGERVFALGITGLFYDFARRGLDQGTHAAFAPGSVVMGGGGGKGVVLPGNAEAVIAEFFGVDRMRGGYGMTEQNFYCVTCEHERLHIPPWVLVVLADPDSAAPLPREGVQTGRATFFDPTLDGAWGGIVSGDRITVDHRPCACGRATLHIDKQIDRYGGPGGGDDKITCAATPGAQAAALDVLSSL